MDNILKASKIYSSQNSGLKTLPKKSHEGQNLHDCYRNENIHFDVDFIAIENAIE